MATKSTVTIENRTKAPRGLQWFRDPADHRSIKRLEIGAGDSASVETADWKILLARPEVEALVQTGALAAI